jgi:NTE family protein
MARGTRGHMASWLWREAACAVKIRGMATVAVVLPGGGARGAYEVGALSVLLPALERRGERVAIWCGTSVGAINATALASLAHLPVADQVSQTLDLWGAMRKQDVISPIVGPGGARMLTRLVKHALGIRGAALASLLDSSPLAGSLDNWIDWAQLQTNVRRGHVEAACVVATSLETGDPVAFVSAANGAPTHSDDTIRYIKAKINGEHVRASAAIPVLFPAVEVTSPRAARGHYIDGGTRLNSPIKPALNLGADKVIVVGLEPFAAARSAASQNSNGHTPHRRPGASHNAPGIADVAANMLDGLLVDQVAYDLRRLAAINTFFAEDAATGTSRAARDYRVARGHKPYRPISYALVAPRRRGDIGRLADAVFERRYGGPRGLRDLDYAVISRALGGRSRSRGELLSFLLFDKQFVSELVVMGCRDATRWLRRHPGFWCRDADHDLSVDRLDRSLISEQQVLDEFRALRRRG